MKKLVRTIWICALSGLAFLGACCSSRGLSKAEKKRLLKERDAIEKTLAEIPVRDTNSMLVLEDQEMRYGLMNKIDSINFRLGEDVDLAKNVRRRELLYRLDSLHNVQFEFDHAKVYGPPGGMGDSYYGIQSYEQSKITKAVQEAKRELELLDQPHVEQNLNP